jgi:hypothetical protein
VCLTDEAIKWPELNSHGGESVSGHALPTHATGRAGFGDDNDNASTIHGGYASSLATTSTPELYPGGGPDPYAVPPLPHLNPNQPYHDEPVGYEQDPNSFYDPYRGPVPNTFNEAGGAEAIPMTQMARTRSPGPQMGYEMGRQSPMVHCQNCLISCWLFLAHEILVAVAGSTVTWTAGLPWSTVSRSEYGLWRSDDGDTWKTT